MYHHSMINVSINSGSRLENSTQKITRHTKYHPDATAILTSNAFLCLLASIPKTVPAGLELAQTEAERFMQLSEENKFRDATNFFRKRGHHMDEDSS